MRHRVFLADRGGLNIITEIDGLVSVQWERVRDHYSIAPIKARPRKTDCMGYLAKDGLEVRHELLIDRLGNDGTYRRVWEGPITYRLLEDGYVELKAMDLLFYPRRTWCLNRYSSRFGHGPVKNGPVGGGPEKVTARTMRIWTTEMARWEAAGARVMEGIIVHENASTAKTTRLSERGSQYVWDDMEELASRGGMDYTVANRSLYLTDTHQFIGQGRKLTDDDFLANLQLVGYGLELSTTSYSHDGLGHFTGYAIDDDYYGPVDLGHAAYDVATTADRIPQSELVAQARRNARSRYPVPLVLRVPENAQLKPDRVDDLLPYLIPCTAFPVYSTSTGREIEQVLKLDKVTFIEDSQGERVNVTLSAAPIGSGTEGLEVEE